MGERPDMLPAPANAWAGGIPMRNDVVSASEDADALIAEAAANDVLP